MLSADAPESEWRGEYPFASHAIEIDGRRYHYLDEGQGETLLAVHGNPTWSFYWRRIVLGLRDRFRLVVPDHMGCGLSDKPEPYPYTLAQHVANLRRLLAELDLRQVTLLAHDWGGAIGMGAAVAEPERFARFVLFNTAAFLGGPMPWRIRVCRLPGLGTWAIRGANAFARAALWMATAKPERMTPAVRSGLLAPYDRWANRVAIDAFVKDIPLSPRHPSYATLAAIAAGLPRFRDAPAALIWGLRDWCFTPWFLERFREFWPQAETHPLADAGHYVVEDAHERIVPLVADFLRRHPLSSPT